MTVILCTRVYDLMRLLTFQSFWVWRVLVHNLSPSKIYTELKKGSVFLSSNY